MGQLTITYDARFSHPKTRHWGVGAVIENVIKRLKGDFHFVGLAPKFHARGEDNIKFWPYIPRANRLIFEASPLLAGKFDLYWGTAHLLPGLLKAPSVLTAYDMLFLNHLEERSFAWFFAQRFRSSLVRASKIVAISRTTADDLTTKFPELKRKIEVVLLGYDAPSVPSDEAPVAVEFPSSPYMMMLGCHSPRKNLSLALATVSRLQDEGVDIQLLITGDVHPSFRDMLRHRPVGIRLVGVLAKQVIFQLLKGASCLLFPSRYEGFGLPILEAMAAGCPVVALDTAINREIAGDAACLLPDDATEWARACQRMLSAHGAREEMKGRGFQNLTRFSWERTSASYGQIFSEIAR